MVIEQKHAGGGGVAGGHAWPVLPFSAHHLFGGATLEYKARYGAAQRAIVGPELEPRIDPRKVARRIVEAARRDLDQSLEPRFAQRVEQVGAFVAKDLVARERLGQKGVHGLFGAAEALERHGESLVGIDRVAHRHHVYPTVPLLIFDEPAD